MFITLAERHKGNKHILECPILVSTFSRLVCTFLQTPLIDDKLLHKHQLGEFGIISTTHLASSTRHLLLTLLKIDFVGETDKNSLCLSVIFHINLWSPETIGPLSLAPAHLFVTRQLWRRLKLKSSGRLFCSACLKCIKLALR